MLFAIKLGAVYFPYFDSIGLRPGAKKSTLKFSSPSPFCLPLAV